MSVASMPPQFIPNRAHIAAAVDFAYDARAK